MQTFDFEITPIAECAETYKAAGATITGIHICARSIDPNASDVQMCRGNNSNQVNYRYDCNSQLLLCFIVTGFSGSSLMIRDNRPPSTWFLIGIVAYGPIPCDLDGWPFVSTRVNKYIEWILENVQ